MAKKKQKEKKKSDEGQLKEDAIKWHDALGHFHSQRDRDAYTAGFEQGWRDLQSALKLHRGVEVTYDKQVA